MTQRVPTYVGTKWVRLVDAAHVWDAAADRIDDVPHYGIDISESEGDKPTADVRFENAGMTLDELLDGRERVLIAADRLDQEGERIDTLLLFDGVVDDTGDVEYGSDDLTVRFEARHDDWEVLQRNLLETIGLPLADPCAGDLSDPVERLDALPSLVHWDRTTRLPALSSLVGDGEIHDVGGRFFRDSLRVRRKGKPLGRVDVVISAEWTQSTWGEVDVAQAITATAGGDLDTFTPAELMNAWPKVGDSIGSYQVSRSALEPAGATTVVVEQAAGAGRGYAPQEESTTTSVKLRRHRFTPTLSATATGSIKRREEVRFSVANGGQGASTDFETVEIKLDRLALDLAIPDWQPGVVIPVGTVARAGGFPWIAKIAHVAGGTSLFADRLRRQGAFPYAVEVLWEILPYDSSPLGSPAAPAFFITPRGKQSIAHGALVAAGKLAYSQRNWEIEFQAEAMELLGIRCRDRVTVRLDRIPAVGNVATGKVKSYTIRLSATEATVSVTLGVCSGSGLAGSGGLSLYPGQAIHRVGHSAVAYAVPYVPPLGVGGVRIANHGASQLERLEAPAQDDEADVIERLRSMPTGVEIDMLPVGGGETNVVIPLTCSDYQGFRGIQLR